MEEEFATMKRKISDAIAEFEEMITSGEPESFPPEDVAPKRATFFIKEGSAAKMVLDYVSNATDDANAPSTSEVADELGITTSAASKCLNDLSYAGFVTRLKRGGYQSTYKEVTEGPHPSPRSVHKRTIDSARVQACLEVFCSHTEVWSDGRIHHRSEIRAADLSKKHVSSAELKILEEEGYISRPIVHGHKGYVRAEEKLFLLCGIPYTAEIHSVRLEVAPVPATA